MEPTKNDYERLADEMTAIIATFLGSAHAPGENSGDSITITKDGFLKGLIELQRLQAYTAGLGKTHRNT